MEKPLERNLSVNTYTCVQVCLVQREATIWYHGENAIRFGCRNHYLSPRKHFGVSWDPAQDFTEDNAKGKHVHLQQEGWVSGRWDRARTEARNEKGEYQ